jgi:predicted PurR-regulated permease PerM
MPLARSEYIQRVLIALGLVALAVILFEALQLAAGVLLFLFAGILLAVLLDGLARLLSDSSPLPRRVALAIVLFALAGAVFATGWYLGPQAGNQVQRLAAQLPEAVSQAEAWLQERGWGAVVAEHVPESVGGALPEGTSGLGALQTAFSSVFGLLANGVIVLAVGIFLAINPSLYVDALVHLVPPSRRPRTRTVFAALGSALRHWLLGRIASMLVVGLLTGIGLMIFGIPLALALGLIAALFSFVPYIGPILALVPALAVAAGEGTQAVITVLAIYGAVQVVESYLVTPLIQQRAVSMPPALLIAAQVLMGALAGFVGVAVATPLVVVLVVLVQMLYVEDVLGDDVEVMGGGTD